MTDVTESKPDLAARTLVAELVGLLGEAEGYAFVPVDERLVYLQRRADLLHRLVDAIGDEDSRYLASDAEDRAERERAVADGLADECGNPRPSPTAWRRREPSGDV